MSYDFFAPSSIQKQWIEKLGVSKEKKDQIRLNYASYNNGRAAVAISALTYLFGQSSWILLQDEQLTVTQKSASYGIAVLSGVCALMSIAAWWCLARRIPQVGNAETQLIEVTKKCARPFFKKPPGDGGPSQHP